MFKLLCKGDSHKRERLMTEAVSSSGGVTQQRNSMFLMEELVSSRLRLVFYCLLLFNLSFILAHPLGEFVTNRYSRIELGLEQVELFYVVDMAEIPTFQERFSIDVNNDNILSQEEQDDYLNQKINELQKGLILKVGNRVLNLERQDQSLELSSADAGFGTMFIRAQFSASLPPFTESLTLNYRDENFPSRVGWQEIVIKAGEETVLLESTAPTEDLSQALTNYPENIELPEISSARFRFEPKATSTNTSITVSLEQATTNQSVLEKEASGFTAMINQQLDSPWAILLAILGAFGWGAAHALTPGHGKTIVAAYLVGSQGTVKHALFLGLTTTITHTLGVFILGLITLFASAYILPEQLYPWLGAASGVLVVWIGLSLFWNRFLSLRRGAAVANNHGHEDITHEDGFVHSHGGGAPHSHLPPSATNGSISWRNLLSLGISGGLIPCPSALVVMLGAIALGRIGFGLILITLFSLGLASVLTAIGIIWVKAAGTLNRILEQRRSAGKFSGLKLGKALPAMSALFISIAGVGIVINALSQTGVLF